MQELIIKITQSWSWLRIFRLTIGVLIGFEAFHSQSWGLLIIAAFPLYQAFANTGCGACPAPSATAGKQTGIIDVDYEEVK